MTQDEVNDLVTPDSEANISRANPPEAPQASTDLPEALDNLFYRYRTAENNGERRKIEAEFVAHLNDAVKSAMLRQRAFDQRTLDDAVLAVLNAIGEPNLQDMIVLPTPSEYDRQLEVIQWYRDRIAELKQQQKGK